MEKIELKDYEYNKLSKLSEDNDFFRSLFYFYEDNNFLTEKQYNSLVRIFEKEKDKIENNKKLTDF